MRSRSAVLAVVLSVLLVAGTAEARRGPHASELAAIAAKLQIPKKCARVYVSTVNHHWASFAVRNAKKACLPYAADGVTVLRRKHGAWHVVTAGSSFECPVPHVPPKIADDLRIHCY